MRLCLERQGYWPPSRGRCAGGRGAEFARIRGEAETHALASSHRSSPESYEGNGVRAKGCSRFRAARRSTTFRRPARLENVVLLPTENVVLLPPENAALLLLPRLPQIQRIGKLRIGFDDLGREGRDGFILV